MLRIVKKQAGICEPHDRVEVTAPRDLGTTFIEILVSVVILGTAGVAVLTALATTAAGASTQHGIAEAQSALATAGDAVTAVDIAGDDYQDCASPAAYAARAQSAAPSVSVASVEYWTGAAWSTTNCQAAAGERLQRVTLETEARGVTRTLSVIKRPATDPTINVGPLSPSSGSGYGNVTITPTPGVTGP